MMSPFAFLIRYSWRPAKTFYYGRARYILFAYLLSEIDATISVVLSLDPSLTIINSQFSYDCFSTLGAEIFSKEFGAIERRYYE